MLVLPVNYVLDGDVIVFRSDPGEKLDAIDGHPASFQIDFIDAFHHTGWSVLVRGTAYRATARRGRSPQHRVVGGRREDGVGASGAADDHRPAFGRGRHPSRQPGVPVMFEHMSQSECIARLVAGRIGRVGVVVEEAPHVLPVNYTSMSNGAVVFRTAEGSLLAAGGRSRRRLRSRRIRREEGHRMERLRARPRSRGDDARRHGDTRAHRPRLDHLGTRTPRPLVLDHTRRATGRQSQLDGRPVRPRLDRGSRLVIPSRKDTNDEQ